jgi:hypothetical protein
MSVVVLAALATCTPSKHFSTSSRLLQESDERECGASKDLVNIDTQLEQYVNKVIDEERTAMGPDLRKSRAGALLAERVYKRLGEFAPGSGWGMGVGQESGAELAPTTGIEVWLHKNLAEARHEIHHVTFAKSRFAESGSGPTSTAPVWVFDSTADFAVSPTVRLGGTLIGTDKIGHAFQQGYWYYLTSFGQAERRLMGLYLEGAPGLTSAQKDFVGKKLREIYPLTVFGIFGIVPTGIISYADMNANEMGYHLYIAIVDHPLEYRFKASELDARQLNEILVPSTTVLNTVINNQSKEGC